MPSTPPTGKRGATCLQKVGAQPGSAILNLKWADAGEAGNLIPQAYGVRACALGSEGCARRREEKELGFRGTEGRLLLLQACGLRVQVAQDHAVSDKALLGGLVPVPSSLSQLLRHLSPTPPACRVLPPGGSL